MIEVELAFGSLVAVIAAYEKLADPWKELLDFYQVKEDAKGRYELLLESFQASGMLDQEQIDAEPETREPITGALVATNLDLKEEDESETMSPGGLSLTAELPASLAIVGGQGCGSDRLAHIIAGLKHPSTGKLPAGAGGPPYVAGSHRGDRSAITCGAVACSVRPAADNATGSSEGGCTCLKRFGLRAVNHLPSTPEP